MTNPWLPAQPVVEEPVQAPAEQMQVWQPQRLDVPAQIALPTREIFPSHRLWVVGAHGGAGTTTWARILDAGDAGCSWPVTGSAVRVLIAARTHKSGLEAARRAAIQWASGMFPHIELVGLLLTPDAPGRTPKPLREVVQSVSGAYPQVFHVPWNDAWRVAEVGEVELDKKTRQLWQNLSHMK